MVAWLSISFACSLEQKVWYTALSVPLYISTLGRTGFGLLTRSSIGVAVGVGVMGVVWGVGVAAVVAAAVCCCLSWVI
jgi:hypothetical protein